MNTDELKDHFKQMFRESIDAYDEPDPKCAYGAGMLVVISALRMKDGPTLPTQIAVMHKALREVGEERGWGVSANPAGDNP